SRNRDWGCDDDTLRYAQAERSLSEARRLFGEPADRRSGLRRRLQTDAEIPRARSRVPALSRVDDAVFETDGAQGDSRSLHERPQQRSDDARWQHHDGPRTRRIVLA